MSVALKQTFSHVRGSSQAASIIIAIGGGKGGVGKSFLSTNIGIFLANMGFNTVLVDLDLGAPNLHTAIGEPPPKTNFHDFLSGRSQSLLETAVATQFPKLRLIGGANDREEYANIPIDLQSTLMSAIHRLEADFTVLDLSAGTQSTTLDFFLMAHHHVIALTPDPTSVENAYRFMKAAFYRRVKRFERQLGLESKIAEIMANAEENKVRVPSDLLTRVMKSDPSKGTHLRETMTQMKFELVLNQARSQKDAQLLNSIEAVCRKYFGIPVSALGHLDYDNSVWNALRKRRPLLLEYPNSPVYAQLLGIARDLASPHLKKAVI